MEREPIARRFEAALPSIVVEFERRDVRLAYLFGSAALGREGLDSDLDVAVLFDDSVGENERSERRFELTTELVGLVHVNDVEVVVLNDAPPRRFIDTQWLRDHYAVELDLRSKDSRTLPDGKGEWYFVTVRQDASDTDRRRATGRSHHP